MAITVLAGSPAVSLSALARGIAAVGATAAMAIAAATADAQVMVVAFAPMAEHLVDTPVADMPEAT
jgi:hypothetical protein